MVREDRQSKQKLEIRRKKPKNSEQIYTGNKGKCRHRLIILNLLINVIYFTCMCPMNAIPKDMTSFTYYSLFTWGYVYG